MPPPPLPAKGGGPALKKANDLANKAPGGAPGNVVAPCKWKLHVNVHSEERFWPKKPFDVVFGAVKQGLGIAKDPGPPISPAWYKSGLKMSKKDSPEVLFCGSGPKNGGVSALVYALKKEADWVLAVGKGSANPLASQYAPESIANGQDHKVDLYIRHPLRVNLEFKFKDPEKKIFRFPKDFPIQVWSDKQVFEKKTDEKGRLSFELDRKYDWITLKFGNGPVFFNCGDGKPDKCDLKVEADRKTLVANHAKFFSPPDTWSLLESIWEFSEQPKFVDGAVAYKVAEGKIYLYNAKGNNWVRRIGEKDAPISLTLDPKWQFNRFEFFDRYYGHSDHGHKRVNIPPILVDAMWANKGKGEREGSGQWVLNEKSAPDTVLAGPWIRQKTDKGAKAEKPDKDSYLMFKTAAGTYSVSSDASTRKVEVIPGGDKRLDPGVDRLKYYDLPESWESLLYWTRFGKAPKQTGKFWKDWGPADYLKSRAVGDPMTFSLDDAVLTDAAFNPLKLAKTDKHAIFYHRFKPAYDEKANVSNHGVYMPDANEPYYSTTKLNGADFNYLTEYPNWVRMLAGLASLYDVFDKRAVSGVLGARAAVKWYDPAVSGAPAGGAVGFQAAIDKKEFVVLNGAGHQILEDYSGRSPIAIDGRAKLFQLITSTSSWEVRHLSSGELAFRNALPYDENYSWPVLYRAGSRMLAFADIQPALRHSGQDKGSSLLQLIEVQTPIETDESKLVRNLARFEALQLSVESACAAAQNDTIAIAAAGVLALFDSTLKVTAALSMDFEPLFVSMDEAGWIYLSGASNRNRALWVLNPQGARTAAWTVPPDVADPFQPPILGYDHRVYLLTASQLVALGDRAELRWSKPVPGGALGAGVTVDGRVLVSAANALLAFDPSGGHKELHKFEDRITTPPVYTAHHEIVVGAGNKVYCLAKRR